MKSTTPKVQRKRNAKKVVEAEVEVEVIAEEPETEEDLPEVETAPEYDEDDDEEPEAVRQARLIMEEHTRKTAEKAKKKGKAEYAKTCLPDMEEYIDSQKAKLWNFCQANKIHINLMSYPKEYLMSQLKKGEGEFYDETVEILYNKKHPEKATKKAEDGVEKKKRVISGNAPPRPKKIGFCFHEDTIIKHEAKGVLAYAKTQTESGKLVLCDEDGEILQHEESNVFESLNAFTKHNYRELIKNGADRKVNNNAYKECKYKSRNDEWLKMDGFAEGEVYEWANEGG